MLLRVPRLQHRQFGGYSMLGFGDIILPGLLAAFTRRLDIDLGILGLGTAATRADSAALTAPGRGERRAGAFGCLPWDARGAAAALRGYFWPTATAYAGGLVLTYMALLFSWFGDQGQVSQGGRDNLCNGFC